MTRAHLLPAPDAEPSEALDFDFGCKPTEKGAADILPSSVPIRSMNFRIHRGIPWVPIFCANCGGDGGWIPEAAANEAFHFYLCPPCSEKWTPLIDTFVIPDEVFWEKVKQVQIEEFGRELTGDEVVEALKDEHHILSKLARERHTYRRSS